MPRRLAPLCAALSVAAAAAFLVYAAAGLALDLTRTSPVPADLASNLRADYSPDPRAVSLPPLSPAIVAAARGDAGAVAVRPVLAVSPSPSPAPTPPEQPTPSPTAVASPTIAASPTPPVDDTVTPVLPGASNTPGANANGTPQRPPTATAVVANPSPGGGGRNVTPAAPTPPPLPSPSGGGHGKP